MQNGANSMTTPIKTRKILKVQLIYTTLSKESRVSVTQQTFLCYFKRCPFFNFLPLPYLIYLIKDLYKIHGK